MGFNKLKSLTSDSKNIIEALKDSTVVEFNSDLNKIRKKYIKNEFLN